MQRFRFAVRAVRILGTVLAVVAGVLFTGQQATGGSLLPSCVLKPQLRDVSVNQGLGSYADAQLIRGKTTLVRLYLEMPACADTASAQPDYIEVTSATLKVTRKAIIPEDLTTVSATPQPVSVYPRIAPHGVAPLNDWSGDPLFAIPGSALAPSSTTTTFTAELTADVAYRAWSGGKSAPIASATFSSANNPRLAAAFAPATNPMRVLVVPMGNLQDGITNEFPTEAVGAVEHGMRALSRMLPVADGVGDLKSAATGGLRYSIDPGMLDLGPGGLNVMTKSSGDYRFCGAQTNFTPIKEKLAAFLQAWNSTNTPADRVVGVVSSTISGGLPDCAEGWASLTSNQAWVRAVPSADGSPSITGATLAMEMGHTFSQVPGDRDDGHFHSPNKEADGSSPNRAYNTTLRAFLADDRSAMAISLPGWNGVNTLFEKTEWTGLACAMTPAWTSGGCTTAGSVGNAGASARFVISGSTNVTATSSPSGDRTEAHSYFASGTASPVDSTSAYTLVQRGSDGSILKSEGVTVRFTESGHAGTNHSHDTASGLFEFTTEVASGAARIELRHTHRSEPLYARDINGVPVIESASLTGGATKNISDPGDGDQPAFTRDGEWIAFRDPATGLRIVRRDGSASVPAFAGQQPAFSQDGKTLAYVLDGSIYIRSFDASAAAVGAARIVYDRSLEQELHDVLGSSAASRPSWDPTGTRIAFHVGDVGRATDIFVMSVSAALRSSIVCRYVSQFGDDCYALTRDQISHSPAWNAKNQIAFVRQEPLSGPSIHVIVPGLATTPAASGISGQLPAWSDGLLAYVSGGSVWTARATDYGNRTRVTTDVDTWPTFRADAKEMAVARTTGAGTDVVVIDFSQRTIRVKASDETSAVLRLDVFEVCAPATFPIFVAEKPQVTTATSGEFTLAFDPSRSCGGGELKVRVTDGYHTAWKSIGFLPTDPNGGSPEDSGYPAGAIYAPVAGSKTTQYRSVALAGTAIDQGGIVPDSRIRWRLQRPDGTTSVVGTGSTPADLSPGAGGWTPGVYTTFLDVHNGVTFTNAATSSFTVLADADNDTRPPGTCAENDANAGDAFEDADNDAILNVDDEAPCTSANNATVSFDPQTLYVPSAGNDVMLFIKSSAVDLRGTDPSTVAISKIGPWYVEITATGWHYETKSKTWQARFNRAQVTEFLASKGLVNQYVPIIVTGRTESTTFRGFDPKYPYVSPN